MGLALLRTFKNLPNYPIEFAMLEIEIKYLSLFAGRSPNNLIFKDLWLSPMIGHI